MAICTGLPELAISIASLWNNVPGVAAGTIVGSNLGDVSLVLGVPAILFGTMNVKKEDKMPLMAMLFVTALVMALVFVSGGLGAFHGVLLIVLYFVSVWWLWRKKATRIIPQEGVVEELRGNGKMKRGRNKIILKTVVKLVGSIVLLVLSSKLSVDCVVVVTNYFFWSLESVGVTIFAIGTSLPELALSLQAVRKKDYALAFGNSFGSVLEQATLILGLLAIGSKKTLDISMLRPVAPIMFLSYAIVVNGLLKKTKVGRQEGLGRIEGFMLIGLFVVHVAYYLVLKK